MILRFDPVLLLPAESYLRNWVGLQEQFYPHAGWGAELYSAKLDHTDLASIERLFTGLQVRYNVNIYSGSTLCLTRPSYNAYMHNTGVGVGWRGAERDGLLVAGAGHIRRGQQEPHLAAAQQQPGLLHGV